MARTKGSKNKIKTSTIVEAIAKRIKAKIKIEPVIQEELTKKTLKPEKEMRSGWVNIQCVDKRKSTSFGTQGFYTGGDIHESEEKAKSVANKNTVAQVFVRWYS